ncbi:MAG: DUF1549 domain-containing protein [Planctomycetaceae bacterium]|nr:DUF1549 domain-containing protein [Planctomycetaceae bacterium]
MSSAIILALGLLVMPELEQSGPSSDAANAARKLDTRVTDGWESEKDKVQPASACDDATFLRRAWLDLAGRVPPFAEADKLAKSGKPLDRAAVIEELLDSPEFAAYWSRHWAEYLLGQRPFDQPEFSGRKLQQFLRESLKANRHYDQIATDLISAEGAMDESGAVNFLLRYNADAKQLAGAVSQKFLGLTLQCAECHDHPHAAWKQSEFWGLSAFFARLRRMNPANPQPNEQFAAVLERPRGEFLVIDKKGKPDEQGNFPTRTVMPQFPGSVRREIAPARRDALSAWLTSPENPYFAKHFVNQVWSRLIGAPLVLSFDPVLPSAKKGDLQPATLSAAGENRNAAILENLRADFVASSFDIRRLVTVITLCETYQRASSSHREGDSPATDSELRHEQDLFARGRTRPLSADQVHLSIGQAFGFFQDDGDHRLAQLTDEEFTYDVPVNSFGSEPQSLGRSLALFNGEHIRGAVDVAAQSLLRIHGDAAGPAHLQRLFLCLLSRMPTDAELEAILDLAGDDIPQRGLEDVTWVILNSAEFQTNH